MALPRRTLGKTGLDVSVLGFGCAPVSYLKTDADQAERVARTFLDAGVNLVDSATVYAGNHKFIGDRLADRRDDMVLVTKVGRPGGSEADFAPEKLKKQVDAALAALKTDRVDVMLIHSCDLHTLEMDEALGALVECREAGKIVHCGYSGDNEAAAFACRLPDIAVLETSVSIADQANIDSALAKAATHNVGVIAKRPIANAAWRHVDEREGLYKKYAETYADRLAHMDLDPATFDMDWPELALRFTLAQPITCAITGTT
ncbi:MAG: aldo/keto reductase, partial [Planctomycetota bacterium]